MKEVITVIAAIHHYL